jgi:MFS family permease
LLTEYAGWKSIFTIAAVLTFLVILATFWKMRGETIEKKVEKFDLPGSIIYAAALILAMYGVSKLPSTAALGFIGGGIVMGILFFIWELRTEHPLLNLAIFRNNRGFTYSNLAALVHYSGTFAVSFLLSLYLQYARGFEPKEAGFILISSPVVQALFSPLFGKLSDRREPRLLASLGMALTALGIGALSFVSQTTPLWYIIGCLALLGFGFALFSSPNSNAVMGSAEPRYYGIASSLLATMRQLGMMVSMGISWAVLAVVMGRVEIKPENYPELVTSVRIAFVISALLCAGAIYFSVARGNIHPASPVAHTGSRTNEKA